MQKLERSTRLYERVLAINRERQVVYERDEQLCETFARHNGEAIVSLKEQSEALSERAEPVRVMAESIFGDVIVEQASSNECFGIEEQIKVELIRQRSLRKDLPNLALLVAALSEHRQAAQGRETAIMQKLSEFQGEIQTLKALRAQLNTAILGLNDRYQTVAPEMFVQSVLETAQIDQSYVDVPRNQPAVENQQNQSGCQIL
jgi:hypothetical protein